MNLYIQLGSTFIHVVFRHKIRIVRDMRCKMFFIITFNWLLLVVVFLLAIEFLLLSISNFIILYFDKLKISSRSSTQNISKISTHPYSRNG